MFPLGRVIYMPLSPSPTLLRPISTDFSFPPAIPIYNATFLSNSFNLLTTTKLEHNALQQTLPHRYKRIRDDLNDAQHKKRSRLVSTNNNNNNNNNDNDNSSTLSKNVLMLLHELKPSIEYKLVAQTGPSHRPIFTMAVEVNGQVFEGMAQTKKEAKQAAAEKALRSFSDLPFSLSDKITSDSISMINIDKDLSYASMEYNNNIQSNTIESYEIQNNLKPLHLLNQLKQDAQFEEITDKITSEQHEYKYAVIINDQRFIGIGQSKRIAKTKAAQFALEKLFGICFNKEGTASIENDSLSSNLLYARHDFADRIAMCIQEKFNQLTQHDVRLQRRKILSGIVLIRNYNIESMDIICITTGTKCINSNRLIRNGRSLNDCHAEIIARRCLIRYCYEQLKLLIDGKSDESIFIKIDNTNQFQLKKSITFHLYISTAPCGDGRIFSPQEISSEKSSSVILNQDLKDSLRKSRGLLRRKIEAGEGTIPVLAKTIYRNIQTWDGTLDNQQRLLTMSCSDKICRWSFIGLQGALLSILIDPIYYTSIIIGSLYHSEHIQRALFSRIEQKVNHMPALYGLRRPFISGVSNPEIRNTTRAPNHTFIWNCADQKCEIVDAFTGLTIKREPSMVSKAALFQQWISLMNKIQPETIPRIYYDAKQLALDYQKAKIEVNKAFQIGGFGLWIKKPNELDKFDIWSSDVSLPSQTNESISSIN